MTRFAKAALVVDGLVVEFDGFKALDGFSMTVEPGELRVLLGANGAGKTTLVDAISGKIATAAGRIVYGGHDLAGLAEHEIARLGVGRKFQVPAVFRDLAVARNLEVALATRLGVWANLLRRTDARGTARVREVLQLTGLEGQADVPAGNLSHGQIQWLELGMVLAQNPGLVLLDEPTAGMTPAETEKTSTIINGLKGVHTLIVVEHDMAFVRSICDRITVMHLGRWLAEGSVAEVERNPAVIEAYLGSGGVGHA